MSEIAYSEQGDRRVKQRDPVVQALQMLSFLSICIIALLAFLIALAQPASYAVINKRSGFGATWDPELCRVLFAVLIAGLAVGTTGLVFNAKRLRRKYDFLRVNLILLSVTSLLGIIIYLSR